jgi:hypothetical protein
MPRRLVRGRVIVVQKMVSVGQGHGVIVPEICKPMGRPARVNPHGSDSVVASGGASSTAIF